MGRFGARLCSGCATLFELMSADSGSRSSIPEGGKSALYKANESIHGAIGRDARTASCFLCRVNVVLM